MDHSVDRHSTAAVDPAACKEALGERSRFQAEQAARKEEEEEEEAEEEERPSKRPRLLELSLRQRAV